MKGSSQGKGKDKMKRGWRQTDETDASWTAVPRGRERQGKESKAKSARERRGERNSIRKLKRMMIILDEYTGLKYM